MNPKPKPVIEGQGELRILGHSGPVSYRIEGDMARLKRGVGTLRGSLQSDPDVVARAFRAGEGVLVLDLGKELRLVMLGHTAGSDRVFVELRV
ncbi:MAG: hypothetical protein GC203_18925 [Phenylobacterium sp.]|uniref:hypothetical protein n=1 Tax=Phenylobacterium sp. TaxID=1871053 RepID=UPI0025D1FEE3|nr:hypothetical protein [Phenylobacterium sp.]MBI1199938.1 hypothetical protein [Phenylobacterium sp.]